MNQGVYLFKLSVSANPKFEMASVFGIATPLVIEIKDRARPIFKKRPFKSTEDDSEGAFSLVPYNILHNEDIRAYIHYDLKELSNTDMLDLYRKHLVDSLGNLKPKYKVLQDKGFSQFIHFPLFNEAEGNSSCDMPQGNR